MTVRRVAREFSRTCANLQNATPEFIQRRLPAEQLAPLVQACGVEFRQRVFTPTATLWLWLFQRLSGLSCRAAAKHAFLWAVGRDQEPPSPDCSGYCRARSRQSEELLKRAAHELAGPPEAEANLSGFDRPVFAVDGTSVHVADTAANRKAFPIVGSQKPGSSRPLVRLVALFGLATGKLHQLAMDGFGAASEQELFYRLWAHLPVGSIVMGDRYFDSFRNLALLLNRGVHTVFRLRSGQRKVDFGRCEKRLAEGDALFTWRRPAPCAWVKAEDWNEAPKTLTVRIIRYTVPIPGFRANTVFLVTTLLDSRAYPAARLAALYGWRWSAEVRLRDLKATLGMGEVDARTPAMVRKELCVYMLAYNFIRQIMQEAAVSHDVLLDRISFKGTVDFLMANVSGFDRRSHAGRQKLYAHVLWGIAHTLNPRRSNRLEPRVRKGRQDKYTRMTEPRHAYERRLQPVHAQPIVA
jgi:hypothetical protein